MTKKKKSAPPVCQVCHKKPVLKCIYDENNKATPACNTCYMRAWRHANRDEWNAYRRERYAKKQDEEYDALCEEGDDE